MTEAIAQPQHRGWFGRNWKWLVPTGCLGSILLLAGFGALIFFGVTAMMKSSDAYKFALAAAKENEAVLQAVGTPIEPGTLVTGKISVSGGSGNADLAIPISGPKGAATIYVVAKKSAGKWYYSTLVVEIDANGERIDILEGLIDNSKAAE